MPSSTACSVSTTNGRLTAMMPTTTANSVYMICSGSRVMPNPISNRVDEPAIAEQHHPSRRAHRVADEERQDHGHQQQILEARSRARETIGHRKGQHHANRGAQSRHADRSEENRDVERIGEELCVVLDRDRVDHHLGRRVLIEAVAKRMTIGSTMPIVTTIDAGATIAAAVHPGAPVRARRAAAAAMIDRSRSSRRLSP